MMKPTVLIKVMKIPGLRRFPGRRPEQPWRYLVSDAGNFEPFERPTERYSEQRGALHAIDQVHGPDAVVALRVPGQPDRIIRAPKDVYPHQEGDVTVIGPECFASPGGAVINWRGVNYVRQERAETGQVAGPW